MRSRGVLSLLFIALVVSCQVAARDLDRELEGLLNFQELGIGGEDISSGSSSEASSASVSTSASASASASASGAASTSYPSNAESSSTASASASGSEELSPSEMKQEAAIEEQDKRVQAIEDRLGQLEDKAEKKMAEFNSQALEIHTEQNDLAKDLNKLRKEERSLQKKQNKVQRAETRLDQQQEVIARTRKAVVADQMSLASLQQMLAKIPQPQMAPLAPLAAPKQWVPGDQGAANVKGSEEVPIGDEVGPGRVVCSGTREYEGEDAKKSPTTVVALHPDFSLTGSTKYKDESEVQLAGVWTKNSLEFVELHDGKIYTFTGKLSMGEFSGAVQRDGSKGTWKCTAKELIIGGKKGTLKDLPEATEGKAMDRKVASIVPGFYRANGEYENEVTKKSSKSPPIVFNLHKKGAMVGKATFQSKKDASQTTVVRMAGTWKADKMEWVQRMHEKSWLFKGTLKDGKVEGEYQFGTEGKGKFSYHLTEIEPPKEGAVAPNPALNLDLPPAAAAPAGGVYNAVAGAPTLEEIEKLVEKKVSEMMKGDKAVAGGAAAGASSSGSASAASSGASGASASGASLSSEASTSSFGSVSKPNSLEQKVMEGKKK